MSVDVGKAVGYLDLDTSGFKSGFQSAFNDLKAFEDKSATVGEKLGSLGSVMSGIGKSMTTYLTVPILGAGVAAGKFAIDFEDAFAQVQTIMDPTQMSINDMKQAIIDLSDETGKSTSELSESVYNAISATGDTANAVSLVSQATKLSTAGFTDSASALSVLTTTMNAYHLSASEAANISDSLIQTQNLGVTTVSELSQSMGKAIASASAYGVNLGNLESAYVSLTKAGINTAESTTYISGMFKELGDSGSDVGKILSEKTGKSFGQLMKDGYSLSDILKILQDSVNGDSEAMMNLWGSAEAGKGANAILSQGVEAFNNNLNTLTGSLGITDKAYETMQTNGWTLKKILNELKNTAVDFGNTLMETLGPAISKISEKVDNFSNWFKGLDDGTKNMILRIAAIVAAIGPLILVGGKILVGISGIIGAVSSISAAATAAGVSITALLGPIGIIIAAVVALTVAFATNFGGIRDKTSAILGDIQAVFTKWFGIVTNLWNTDFLGIRTIVTEAWEDIEKIFGDAFRVIQDVFDVFSALLTGDWDKLGQSILNLWNDLWKTVYDVIGAGINLVVNLLVAVLANLYKAVTKGVKDIVHGFVSGWNDFISWWTLAVTDPVKFWNGIGESMYNAGAAVFQSLWDGAISIWNGIVSWVSDAVDWIVSKVQFWKEQSSKVSAGGGSGRSSRSHASGLDYVPYDGYQATLHQGERVITAQENKQGIYSNKAQTIILKVPLSIDGREFAYAEAKYIDEEMS
jgi:TP901 family phage tail tape measure protein